VALLRRSLGEEPGVEPVVEPVDAVLVDGVPWEPERPVGAPLGEALPPVSPPPDESSIAATTPAAAAAATTAASTAFLTRPEATLARPWLHAWKSS
jgi:hypothetical protein